MTKTISIPFSPNGSTMRSEHVLRINGRRYKMGGVPVGGEGRQEHQGPMVPGPWAYVFELCTVMDDSGTGTSNESAQMRAAGTEHELSAGDRVTFDGQTYEITISAMGDVSLVLVQADSSELTAERPLVHSATPAVDMPATVCYYTDRHAATVIAVSPSGSKVTVHE